MKCGVGDYTGRLAEALGAQEGLAVAVLTDVAAGSASPGSGVTLFPILDGWNLLRAVPILRTARKWKPDLVHIQYPTQGYRGSLLSYQLPLLVRAAGFPVVQTWHEYKPAGSVTVFANALVTRGIIVVRPEFAASSSPRYGWIFRRRPVRYIPSAAALPATGLTEDERASIRRRLTPEGKKLIVHFGFVSSAKNVEALFDIADPERDHIVLACDLDPSDPCHAAVLERTRNPRWDGKTSVTGFLPPEELGGVLAASDAVVFPFRDGGGDWNSSIQGAAAQGTFVLTTSRERSGFDAERNMYFAEPGNLGEMRAALARHAGHRGPAQDPAPAWNAIAHDHVVFYRELLGKKTSEGPA
jgi:glycosyltransferase involved in cell wall biosynthesis